MEPPITTGSLTLAAVASKGFVLKSLLSLADADPVISAAILAATSALFLINAISNHFHLLRNNIFTCKTSKITLKLFCHRKQKQKDTRC